MKKLVLISLSLLMSVMVVAQKGDKRKKIEEAKKKYISQKLRLTSSQEKDFWPVYNEYSQKRRGVMKELKSMRKDGDELLLNDEELLERVNKHIALRKEQVEIDETYKDKLLKIISVRQLVVLHKSEREFMKILREKAGKGNHQGNRRGPGGPGGYGGPNGPNGPNLDEPDGSDF